MRYVPNILTLLRIGMVPLIAATLYTRDPIGQTWAAGIFLAACLTDFLDGFVARTYAQITRFGQFLDPVADKILIISTLMLLAGFGRMSHAALVPAIFICARELLISGLREFLSDFRVFIPVTRFGKWKTGVQMTSITLLLLPDPYEWLRMSGEILLWVAAILGVISGARYLKASYGHFS